MSRPPPLHLHHRQVRNQRDGTGRSGWSSLQCREELQCPPHRSLPSAGFFRVVEQMRLRRKAGEFVHGVVGGDDNKEEDDDDERGG